MCILCKIDWNAVSAITSAVMATITLFTLIISSYQNKKLRKQNDEQLKEVKKQWEEEQRPYLELALVRRSYYFERYDLEIRNIGKTSAESILFKFNDAFLAKLTDAKIRDFFASIGKTEFKILPNEIKYFRLLENDITASKYYLGNTSVNRVVYDDIKNLLKTTGVEMQISYNKYEKSEILILEENRHQTISQVEAINSIAVQLALLSTENKVGSTHDTK